MERVQNFIDKLYFYSIDHFVNYRRHFKEYFWAILIALALRSMVLTIYKIPTGSMIPTFREGDVLIANRFYYGLKIPFTDGLDHFRLPGKKPTVGDVLIFRAPEEENFYQLALNVKTKAAEKILLGINQASSFKRPISRKGSFTNYILFRGNFDDAAIVFVHHKVYKKYKQELENKALFDILRREKISAYMTYHEHKYSGFIKNILDTPLSGLSMVSTVILNTPIGFLPKLGVAYLIDVFREPFEKNGFKEEFKHFSLYPNPFVDMIKDFVKRIVAKEGDKVEMVNKILYINGEPRKLDGPISYDPGRNGGHEKLFAIYNTTFNLNENGKDKTITHPVRLLNPALKGIEHRGEVYPDMKFESGLWPYDSQFTRNGRTGELTFKDNFGPVTVPKDHYFVLGDNRDESLDGRFWGCVPYWAVKGTPMVIIFPPNHAGRVK